MGPVPALPPVSLSIEPTAQADPHRKIGRTARHDYARTILDRSWRRMTDLTFEAALNDRTNEMLDACTRCGKCVEVCPSAQAANIKDAAPEAVITGILDIVRTGDGPEMSRRWAASCTLSGACIEACYDGVNPRFLLAMARVAIRQRESEPAGRRRDG